MGLYTKNNMIMIKKVKLHKKMMRATLKFIFYFYRVVKKNVFVFLRIILVHTLMYKNHNIIMVKMVI